MRQLRLTLEQLEEALRKGNFINENEFVHGAHVEPGELVVDVDDE